jgi:hypothetical protein
MARTISFLDNRYELYILPEARAKMELYCDLVSGEIGWLAFVERFDTGFLITDCVLLKQEVHAATTEIDPSALLEFWNETPVEKQCKIKCWGHSHVNMSTTPSGQDESQMEYFKDGNDWFIRLITNKKREYNIDIFDYANGVKVHLDQADLKTLNPQHDELKKSIEAEIKEKVSEKKTTSSYSGGKSNLPLANGYNSYNRYRSNKTKKSIDPMLEDIEVEYIRSFDEVLNSPNYWADIAAYGL